MTGYWFKKEHYEVAKYHASNSPKNFADKKLVVMNEKEFEERIILWFKHIVWLRPWSSEYTLSHLFYQEFAS